MAGETLGSFVATASWLMVAATATVCQVKVEIETKQASTEYTFDVRHTSSNIINIRTESPVTCIQRCLRECLCYHANYKAIDKASWVCELVSYSACGVQSGVRIESGKGWSAVKLSKVGKMKKTKIVLSSSLSHTILLTMEPCSGGLAGTKGLGHFSFTIFHPSRLHFKSYCTPYLEGP